MSCLLFGLPAAAQEVSPSEAATQTPVAAQQDPGAVPEQGDQEKGDQAPSEEGKPAPQEKDAAAEKAAAPNTDAPQDADAGDQANPPPAYVPAIQLLPDTVAGLIRVPNLPKFCDAWEKTNVGQLMEEESMQPFIEAQRSRLKEYLDSIDHKVGIRPKDLYEIASGEAVLSWLPFEQDERRPFAVCVVADVRGRRAKAEAALTAIDKDLKDGAWVRKDVTYRGQTVRIYDGKPKPGQLKVEQIAITLDDTRIIAADRDSVVTDILDAIAGEPKGKSISSLPEFRSVLMRSTEAVREPISQSGGTPGVEWFARPFPMARVLREAFDVDRRNQVDIVKLLENQGFDALKAAGGIFVLAGEKFDMLHRGFVLGKTGELEEGARMLQFFNAPYALIPAWVHEDVATFNRVNLRIEEAFWASETLINEAFGDVIFRDIIDGIREDEDGPQIDIEKNVLPNLDDQIILITDNTLPADENSERMLVAIRVKDAEAIQKAIRKAMEVEPDASKLDVVPGVEIWRVERGQGNDELDAELFGDLKLGLEDEEMEQAPPLLEHWAIALVDQGPGSDAPYLMFSSHPDLLVLTAKRIREGAEPGLQAAPDILAVVDALKGIGCKEPSFDRAVRTRLSLRVKYQLLRQGKLKESDSIMATLYRRMMEEEEKEPHEPLNAANLPPLNQIEQFLPNGGAYTETTEEGWTITGFLLK